MPPRRGFLERLNPASILDSIVRAIERVFEGGAESPPPPRPPPPPPPGTGGGGGPSGNNDRDFRATWREETGTRAGREYRDEFDIFISLPGVADEPHSDQIELWEHYIETWVTNERDRQDFAEEFGIDLDDFPWEEWREARGYSRKK